MHGTITPLDRAKSSTIYQRLQSSFNDALTCYMETGVLFLEDPKITPEMDYTTRRRIYREQAPPIPHVITRRVVRQIAKELKRPVVIAEKFYWGDGGGRTKVTIRKAQKRAALVSSFLLLENSEVFWWSAENAKKPVHKHADGTNWYLFFNGAKGHEQFKSWLEFIRTEPACRKALQLD